MSSRSADSLLETELKEGIHVVRIVIPDLLHDNTIECIGERIRDLIQSGCRQLVLDFTIVQRMSSHMLGQLVVLLKRMLAAGGKMVLCSLSPEVRSTFTLLRLDRIFSVRDTEAEALRCCREI
jgi:anti-sigma B factor antagonist